MTVRTRFAPSPTGVLHVGGARTALFNWLMARHHGGVFILRVEDTDRERSTDENIQVILDGMRWLGLEWDEGPFYQMQRMNQYRAAIDRLLAEGRAYRCRCTPEELEAKHKQAQAQKAKWVYDRACRDKHYGPEQPHVIRFAMPIDGVTVMDDAMKGRVEVNNAELDDWIIARSDGMPTYNFCVVVDDTEMAITHVIRGDDHLNNTPKQMHLYHALGCPLPVFAHVPMILGSDRSKLSKRHGATNILEYRALGYLPETMRNFLARLGWSHGDQELFTDEEMIRYFDLGDINKSASIFDQEKLNWLNAEKMRELQMDDLISRAMPFLLERNFPAQNDARLPEIFRHLVERAKTLSDLADRARLFYEPPAKYDEKSIKQWWKGEAKTVLERFIAWIKTQEKLVETEIMPYLEKTAGEMNLKVGQVAQPIRIALTGSSASPPLDAIIVLLGREECVARVEKALKTL